MKIRSGGFLFVGFVCATSVAAMITNSIDLVTTAVGVRAGVFSTIRNVEEKAELDVLYTITSE